MNVGKLTKEKSMLVLKEWMDKHLKGDPVIWFIVFALSVISILVVYSATGTLAYKKDKGTEFYLVRHSFLVFMCFFGMWIAHKVDYRYYSRISRFALIISAPLLIFTWLFGSNINEASRWLTIPIINQSFQPSDLAKLALIANLASMLSKRQQIIDDIKDSLVPILFWCGLICCLIALTNFSTAALLFCTCMLLMFIGRVPLRYLIMLVLVGVLAGVVAAKVGQRFDTMVSRVEAFLDPTEIPFQAEQSYVAISTGGLLGKGPGNSESRNILPHPYSDFIFAILIEEYGMIGGIVVVCLYLALLYRGMVTASKSSNAFGGLLSAGLSFSLAIQALINMAVAVGIVPVTGQPLPLLSMGGTSLLFTGLSFGIILSVSRGESSETLNSSTNKNGVRKPAI